MTEPLSDKPPSLSVVELFKPEKDDDAAREEAEEERPDGKEARGDASPGVL